MNPGVPMANIIEPLDGDLFRILLTRVAWNHLFLAIVEPRRGDPSNLEDEGRLPTFLAVRDAEKAGRGKAVLLDADGLHDFMLCDIAQEIDLLGIVISEHESWEDEPAPYAAEKALRRVLHAYHHWQRGKLWDPKGATFSRRHGGWKGGGAVPLAG